MRFYRTTEAAAILGISAASVRRAVKLGRLRARHKKLSGIGTRTNGSVTGQLAFTRADLARFSRTWPATCPDQSVPSVGRKVVSDLRLSQKFPRPRRVNVRTDLDLSAVA